MFENNRSHRLRRLVVELSGYHPEDRDAILGVLRPIARQKIENLLNDYGHLTAGRTLQLDNQTVGFDGSRFSPWLAERLSSTPMLGAAKMTDHARAALRSSASGLFPEPVVEDLFGSSLLSRLSAFWSSFLRGTS